MRIMARIAATATLLAATAAQADRVIMDNGDRYSGRITSMSNGILEIESEFGSLRLPWDRVAQLSTDQAVELTLESGTRISGTVTAEDGIIRFDSQELAGLALHAGDVLALEPADAPDLRIEGRINAGAAATRGNTDTESYHANGEFVARTTRNRFRAGGEINYGSEEGRRVENDVSAALGYDHFVGRHWYVNSNIGLARDEFKDLDLRTTVGVGVGYQFRDLASDRLAVETGVNYVHEDFDMADDRGRPAARYALDFLRTLQFGPTLFHRHELLIGFEDAEDVLLQTETGLRFPLMRSLTGTVQVDVDYDWQPPPGAERGDIAYLVTLGYEL
jgi:putative salt-induced outer membrane protein YdiY